MHVANAHFEAITTLNWPHPTGCSGEDNVTGQQRHIGGNKTHQLSAAEDHLTGVGVLPELPVLEELNGLLDDGRVTGLPGSDQENDSEMQDFEEIGGLEVAEQLHNEIDQYLNRHRNKR